MQIKCISLKLSNDQLSKHGRHAAVTNNYVITINKCYNVFGLTFNFSDFSVGCFVEIISDNNNLVHVPIVLFEIVDNRPSNYWVVKKFSDGTVTLWPPSFYQEFYHDDLSEGVPEIMEDFKRVKEMILSEYNYE